jgi:hypothetical protein
VSILLDGKNIFRTASIISCVDCGPIVLGPISDLLILRDLRNVIVSAVCCRIQIENCQNVRLFLNCETAPIVGLNCSDVQLAPYNVFFDVSFYKEFIRKISTKKDHLI